MERREVGVGCRDEVNVGGGWCWKEGNTFVYPNVAERSESVRGGG